MNYSTNLLLNEPTPGDPAVRNTWGTILNTNDTLLDSAVAGVLPLSVAGSSNVILTSNSGAADQSRNQQFTLSGALTGNIYVLWPNGRNRMFSVTNNTTGAFTLSCAVNNGSGTPAGTSVAIMQGDTVMLYSNGTDVKIRAAGSLGSFTNLSASGTLSVGGATTLTGTLSAAATTITGGANASAITASNSLTGSSVNPLLNLTATWNTSGQAVGISFNATDTSSASNSLLLDLLVGGTPKYYVTKAGTSTQTGDANIGGALAVTGNGTIGGTLGVTGVITGIGSGLTALNATNLASGTVPTARLGTGTANSSTILYGNNTWGTAPSSPIKVWVSFNGITGALLGTPLNVSSVTRTSAGQYTIVFTNALADANYAMAGSTLITAGTEAPVVTYAQSGGAPLSKTTTQVKICVNEDGNFYDQQVVSVIIASN